MADRVAAEVRRYLSDCRTFGRLLDPHYHPTEGGALKMIYHRGRHETDAIREAYRKAVSESNDKSLATATNNR